MNSEDTIVHIGNPNVIADCISDGFVPEEGAPVITETQEKPVISDTAIEDSPVYEDFETEADERLRIQNMTPEETMQYLAQSLNEINTPPDLPPALYEQNEEPLFEPPPQPQPQPRQTADTGDLGGVLSSADVGSLSGEKSAVTHKAAATGGKYDPLTVEPFWGDIYIKASRNLRELCEQGKLSMEQIEEEINERLLSSAEQFMEVTKDKAKVPKVLIPKITELKVAVGNIDPYFQAGEDIAVRAMFFMLYQMLSYSDRIAETPETKENLNDFFRRFGPAGITLSMLDMRV